MGQTFGKVRKRLKSKKIVLFGPQGSGKSTLVGGLKHKFLVNTAPTVCFDCISLPGQIMGSLGLTIFDLGGNERNQALWPNFYLQTSALIWVSRAENVEEDMQLLQSILDKEMILSDIPLLVVLNSEIPVEPSRASNLRVGSRPTRVICVDVRKDFTKVRKNVAWLEKEASILRE